MMDIWTRIRLIIRIILEGISLFLLITSLIKLFDIYPCDMVLRYRLFIGNYASILAIVLVLVTFSIILLSLSVIRLTFNKEFAFAHPILWAACSALIIIAVVNYVSWLNKVSDLPFQGCGPLASYPI